MSQPHPARNWCFTLNNPCSHLDFDHESMAYLIYSEEMGPEGTYHFQGYVQFLKKVRLTALKKISQLDGAHWEKARGTPQECKDYCSKMDDTHLAGPYEFGTLSLERVAPSYTEMVDDLFSSPLTFDKVKHRSQYLRHKRAVDDVLRDFSDQKSVDDMDVISFLRPWQASLVRELQSPPHPRKVIWYVDTVGGSGKSALVHFLIKNHGAVMFDSTAKERVARAYNRERIVCFDIARDDASQVNYGTFEKLKDGVMFSTMYDPRMKVFAPPHVIVFANIMPDRSKLSEDRWDIRDITREVKKGETTEVEEGLRIDTGSELRFFRIQ